MRNSRSLLAFALLTASSACGGTPDTTSDDDARFRSAADFAPSYKVKAPSSLPGTVIADVLSGCSDERLVVELSETVTCPDFDKWVTQPVLAGFCSYTHNGEAAPDRTPIDAHPSISAVHQDCVAVTPQRGSALEAIVGEDVRDAFARRVGYLHESDLNLAGDHSTEPYRDPVTVAVIDTVPRSAPTDMNAEHGENLARVIDSLACPNVSSATCAVAVERELGLPRIEHDVVDLVHGGYMGSFTDLARGIVDAVDAWDGSSHLVLNLSVGWEFDVFGGDHPGSDAVRSAAQYAYCHGALLISSAGNDGGLCQEGPLAPAILASSPAPSAARCSALGVATADQVLEGPAPLVHAVGGLDFGDNDMPGARIGGRTKLMATASHGMGGGTQLTTPLTGTSVSAAAVSGAAALVWSYNDGFSRSDVMEALYEGGDTLPFSADVPEAYDTGVAPSRRLSLCGAMEYACDLDINCTLSLSCAPPVDRSDIDAILLDIQAAPATAGPDLSFGSDQACEPTICDVAVATPDTSDCSRISPDPAAPYADPQPGSTICSVCGVNGFTVTGSLDQHVDANEIAEVVLAVSVPFRRSQILYPLGAPQFTSAGILRMRVTASALRDPLATYSIIGIMKDGSRLTNALMERH